MLPKKPKNTNLTRQDFIWCRRLVSISILSSFPLRISQVAELEIGKHLIKRNGKWFWDISKKMFKNRDFSATDVYMPCAKFLGRVLDMYLTYYRPKMEGGLDCNYLLRGCLNAGVANRYDKKKSNVKKICNQTLWSDVRIATSLVDDDNCNGWSFHLFRHLTTIGINAEIGGVKGSKFAADVLCDSKEVAEKNYNITARDDSLNEYTKMVNAFDDGKEYQSKKL